MTIIRDELYVPSELAGQRLDKAAAQLFDDFSRAELSRMISAGALTVDGAVEKPRHKLLGGECLRLTTEPAAREAWDEAEPIELHVLYEDEDLLVIDKPAGLVVHPGAGNRAGTLVNGLLHHRPQLAELPRAGLVHRLDKDTSGLIVVAASARAHKALVAAIAARAVERIYAAVCEGRMVAGREIDRPIGRDPRVRTRQAVRDDGKPAHTSIRVRERFRAHTLVGAKLASGRTHQIRVHMQSLGHPLVGDVRYGARGRLPVGADAATVDVLHGFKRQALHAEQLGFAHPAGGEWLRFEAPWPEDLVTLVDALRKDRDARA